MRFANVAEVPSPLLAHHHIGGNLCEVCDGNVRIAASAVVGQVLAAMRHDVAGSHDARARGWGVVTRIAAAGPCATLIAFDYLAAHLEASACPHMRDPLGAPDIRALLDPVPAAIAADMAAGVEAVQRYLSHRAAAVSRARCSPDLADAAGLRLGQVGRARLGVAVLALAAAGVELHAPHDAVITAASIAAAEAGTDHVRCPSNL